MKRKTYDDELRREELLNMFRRFQSTSQKVFIYILPPFFPALFVSSVLGVRNWYPIPFLPQNHIWNANFMKPGVGINDRW